MEKALVCYDQDYGFCCWSLAKLLRLDRARRLRPVPIQPPEADVHLSAMDDATRIGSWHLVVDGSQVYSGGAAVASLLELLSGGKPPAALFRRFPRLTDRGYRWVAGHRTALARGLKRSLLRPTRLGKEAEPRSVSAAKARRSTGRIAS